MQYYPGHYKEQNISMCPKCKEKKKKKNLIPQAPIHFEGKENIWHLIFILYVSMENKNYINI